MAEHELFIAEDEASATTVMEVMHIRSANADVFDPDEYVVRTGICHGDVFNDHVVQFVHIGANVLHAIPSFRLRIYAF